MLWSQGRILTWGRWACILCYGHRVEYSPGVVGHVLGQVGEQHGHVKADVLGRVVEAVGELVKVHPPVLVGVYTHHDVLDLLSADGE